MSTFNPDRNPFEYCCHSQQHYESLVDIYRQYTAKVETGVWIKMACTGTYDETHVIGEVSHYHSSLVNKNIPPGEKYEKQVTFKSNQTVPKHMYIGVLQVYSAASGAKTAYYTTIHAKPPASWEIGNFEIVPVRRFTTLFSANVSTVL
jgi:hypothetical protein